MMNAFAADHLAHPYEIRGRALEADYCVAGRHIPFKLIRLVAALHY
jgi:hypothetical protein